MIEVDNHVGVALPLPLLEKILNYLGGGDVELLLVENETMRQINQEYRHINTVTDVLSFPLNRDNNPHLSLGSIVISYHEALKVSQLLGHSIDHEIALLFVHGLLHLLGFDHEQDKGEHRAKEKEIIDAFSLPESLIIRSESKFKLIAKS